MHNVRLGTMCLFVVVLQGILEIHLLIAEDLIQRNCVIQVLVDRILNVRWLMVSLLVNACQDIMALLSLDVVMNAKQAVNVVRI